MNNTIKQGAIYLSIAIAGVAHGTALPEFRSEDPKITLPTPLTPKKEATAIAAYEAQTNKPPASVFDVVNDEIMASHQPQPFPKLRRAILNHDSNRLIVFVRNDQLDIPKV